MLRQNAFKIINLFKLLLFAALIFLIWPRPEPLPNLFCNLTGISGQPASRFGNLTGPIKSIEVSGYAGHPFEKELYSFSGVSLVSIGTKNISAKTNGNIFLTRDMNINALNLHIEYPDFGLNGLKISTLNSNGLLDSNTSESYAYTAKEFKMYHPMQYKCRTTLKRSTKA